MQERRQEDGKETEVAMTPRKQHLPDRADVRMTLQKL